MMRAMNSSVNGRFSDRTHLSSCLSSGHSPSVVLRAALSLLVLVIAVGNPLTAFADQPPPQQMVVAYQDGKITGVYEATIQIDYKTYSLTPDVILLDRHGDELNARYMQVDTEVKYHLEKGSKDRIDRMILFIPE